MCRITNLLAIILLLGLLAIGCQNQPNPTGSIDDPSVFRAATSQLTPTDVENITSATLNMFVTQMSGQQVDAHRITADWDEGTVTWTNFSGAFDATVEGSFVADGLDWRSVDVTALVVGWLDGTHDNFGILLDQVEMNFPRTRYNSREALTNQPYLEICFDTDGGTVCEQFTATADTYIWERLPDLNTGDSEHLFTGWKDETDFEKQTLVRFEIEIIPDEGGGCTLTIGYWKTHAGFGPQDDMVTQYLPIMVGDEEVIAAARVVEILSQTDCGGSSNGIVKLSAQLLGAKLNVANGASDFDVADVIAAADAFLETYDCEDWDSLAKSDKKMVLDWKDTLDGYNNGDLGPGHCDDYGEFDD